MGVIIPFGAQLKTLENASCFGCGSKSDLEAVPLYKFHICKDADYIVSEDELIAACPKCRETLKLFFAIGRQRKQQKRIKRKG